MSTSDLQETVSGASAPQGRRVADFRPGDAAAVAQMFTNSEEGWPEGFNNGVPMTAQNVLRMWSERQPLAVLIAWEGQTAVGWCSLYEYPGERDTAGYVGLLNVDPAFQGQGYGRDLLKEALRRCLDQGYRRLDLGTWPGNMKAIPLYKKSGYVWVPETDVHMENYLPLLLSLPILADFWAQTDWYSAQVRDLAVAEDLCLDGKMRVYRYEFRHGARYVRATIDATARSLTALETERWRVSCTVDDRSIVAGRPRHVRWEVENRTEAPIALTLLGSASAGLRLSLEESALVAGRYAVEAPLHVADDYQPPAFGQSGPRVESLVLLDGQPLRLETGVEVTPAMELRLDPRRISLRPGQARDVRLHARNNLEQVATLRVRLLPSPGLAIGVATGAQDGHEAAVALELPLAAQSYGGATLRLLAEAPGVHAIEARATVTVGDETLTVAPVLLPAPAVGSGAIVALPDEAEETHDDPTRDRAVRLETATHRLVVRLRRGEFHLEDALSGEYLIGGRLHAGPPFSWLAQARVRHEASIEERDGSAAVILRGAVPHLPEIVVEHALCLAPDGLLGLQTTLANAGETAQDVQGGLLVHVERDLLPAIALPTTHGLVVSDDVSFPDWNDPALHDPALFAEGWLARQGDGRVVGALWSEAARIEMERWALAAIVQGGEALSPGERRVLPPVYLYAGPGDWRAVRARWRALLHPEARRHDPPVREVVTLSASPLPRALLAGGSTVACLESLANREAAGELRIEAPPGWDVTPVRVAVSGLCIGRPHEVTLSVRRTGERRAAAVRATLRTPQAEQTVLAGALLDLGGEGAITITRQTHSGHEVLLVQNGYLRFRLAPEFLGSLIALETMDDGVNHLLSAFPASRAFSWMQPWYGGLHAAVYKPGRGEFPDVGRLYEETFSVEEETRQGLDGRAWQGLTVRSMLSGKGLRGLELRASYLTLPGSNLLAARVAVRNHSGATLPVEAALLGYLQPGGTVEGAEMLGEASQRRLLRAFRIEHVPGTSWVAARNARTGLTAALVCAARDAAARVYGLDYGDLGAHVAARFTLEVAPGEERGALSFLALAGDEDEARAYRVLADAPDVP